MKWKLYRSGAVQVRSPKILRDTGLVTAVALGIRSALSRARGLRCRHEVDGSRRGDRLQSIGLVVKMGK